MYFCTVSQIVIVQSCTMLLVHLTVKYMYERCDVTQSQCLCLRHVTDVCFDHVATVFQWLGGACELGMVMTDVPIFFSLSEKF